MSEISDLEINSFLNPEHWGLNEHGDYHEIGHGGEPWPNPFVPVTVFEAQLVRTILANYQKAKNKQIPVVLEPGDIFDRQKYSDGTVFLTMGESLIKPNDQEAVGMADFLYVPVGSKPGINDESRELRGHGYLYTAQQWVNVIADHERPYMIRAEDVNGKNPRGIDESQIRRSLQKYEVGKTYHFTSDHRETLKRVNAHIIYMGGVKALA
ncbi:MAG TPA: hypothetical protein VFB59_00570 [Candidatus Saccharimonadales bacterium]|nr:hypothetical protein [Candidatus Saccharimonadales bacterium]